MPDNTQHNQDNKIEPKDTPSLFDNPTRNQTVNYLDEDELKAEIAKVQKTQRLNKLYALKDELEQYAKYKWEKQELQAVLLEISEIEENGGDKNYSLNRFGEMIMLLLRRIASRPNFSGYTWKDDFYSDATEKIFKYIHNFNPDLTSKLTGKPVKAFGYITQIAMHSFIHIINKNKAESEMIKNLIPLISYDPSMDTSAMDKMNKDSFKRKTIELEPVVFDVDIDIREQDKPPFNYNNKQYESLFELIKDVYTPDKVGLKIILHKNHILPISEYNSIIDLNIDPLNITRYEHKNSFPKKQKTKKNTEEQWLEYMDLEMDKIERLCESHSSKLSKEELNDDFNNEGK